MRAGGLVFQAWAFAQKLKPGRVKQQKGAAQRDAFQITCYFAARRRRANSESTAPAATDAFKDSTHAVIGMEMMTSQFSRTKREMPFSLRTDDDDHRVLATGVGVERVLAAGVQANDLVAGILKFLHRTGHVGHARLFPANTQPWKPRPPVRFRPRFPTPRFSPGSCISRAGYVPKEEAAAQERAGATRELLFPDHRSGHGCAALGAAGESQVVGGGSGHGNGSA